MDHTFQLVITRVYEDGNEELIEDEEESELSFAQVPLSMFGSGSACISAKPSCLSGMSSLLPTPKEAVAIVQATSALAFAEIIARCPPPSQFQHPPFGDYQLNFLALFLNLHPDADMFHS